MSARAPATVSRSFPVLVKALLLLAAGQATLLPLFWLTYDFVLDAQGRGIPTDFINVWSAGQMALEGRAAQAYDWTLQKTVEIQALGRDFDGIYGWHYPPPFLAVAALLATMPFALAHLVWPLVSFVPFAAVMRGIVGQPLGWIVAAGFPVTLANVMVGQNGFLTAALIGGALALMPGRPVLAGVCLGLLSYKPQYGLLFPLALLAAAQWRCIASATVTVLASAAASLALFGVAAWDAFAHWMPIASKTFLNEGGPLIWGKMQSVYSATRFLGGSDGLAWSLQTACAIAAAAFVVTLWRSRAAHDLKAAGLAAATLLVTPYIFFYDLMVLAVAIAFLVRLGLNDGFRRFEIAAIAAALAMLLLFCVVTAPTGLAASVIVAALVVRRARPAPAPRLATTTQAA